MDRACAQAGRPLQSVRLVTVTKMQPVSTIQALIELGLREFGESRVREIAEKAPLLHGDFRLHMIGRLQTNKVAQALPHIDWIQSIDRERLITALEARHPGLRKIKALVEVNTSGEASKSGCPPAECRRLCELTTCSGALEFRGLMTIGPLRAPENRVRECFALLRRLGEGCRDLAPRVELSMGMSDDFTWAIAEGSTMIRVGTALVGNRF